MTRKESDALLKEMRATGIVAKVRFHYHDCICATVEHYYRAYDEFIAAAGSGGWAVRNAFRHFYEEVKDGELIKKLPSEFYYYGL